ncbi:MAG: hypothetical protein WA124_07770, partial [Smithella sp.]
MEGQDTQYVLGLFSNALSTRLRARGDDLDPLIKRVAQITQVTPDEIFDSLRDAKRTKARSILCY